MVLASAHARRRLVPVVLTAVVMLFGPALAQFSPAQEPAAEDQAKQDRGQEILQDQARLRAKYQEFEDSLIQLANAMEATDPGRAELLRKAFAQAKEREIGDRMATVLEALQKDLLTNAVRGQSEVEGELQRLFELLLSESRPDRLADEKARLKEYLKRVKKLIRDEEEIRGLTERGGDLRQIAERQGRVAEETGRLGGDIARNEGKDQGKSPGQDGKGKGQEGMGEDAGEGQGKGQGQNQDQEGMGKGKGQEGEGEGQGKGKGEGEGQGKGQDDPKGKNQDDMNKGPGEGQGKGQDSPDGKGQDDMGKKPGEGQGEGMGQGQGEGEGEGQGKGEGQGQGQGQGEGEGEGEGQDSQSNPSEDSIQNTLDRIQQAQQRMQEAKQRLEKAQREGAIEAEKQALEELRQIEKELEELLRQLREEEMKRLLEYLEARFKKMLEMQIAVYEGTLRLDRVPEDERGRGEEIQAGRLSRQESLILLECDKALQLLREDGSAVALPEAVGQMREDIQQVVVWLSQMKIGPMTQGVEEDIITALEEIIAALQKAQKDLEEQQGQQQPPPTEGQPQEPPLIDMLAELKMLRSLQLRVNNRTVRYSEQLENPADEVGQAQQDELIQALKDLSQREQRIFEATRDIVTGRNR